MREKIKDNLFSNVFSLVFGSVITMLFFLVTSNPSTPEEVKDELLHLTSKKLLENYRYDFSQIKIDKLFSKELDIGSEKSIFMLGTAVSEGLFVRWVSIFDKEPPDPIDKLIGRTGFLKLSSFTSFEVSNFGELTFNKIEAVDLNDDGLFEVHINIKSTSADLTSVGPILYSKNDAGDWLLITLPSISKTIHSEPSNFHMHWRSIEYFGIVNDKNHEPLPLDILKSFSVFEEIFGVTHNGKKQELIMLRNGGDYFFKKHSVKGYSQIQTLSFFADEGAVLSPHYAVVNMFKFYESSLKVDELWNWGAPIYSTRPLKLSDINIESISKAGIVAHTEGDVFFGDTEFEKIRHQ